MKMYGYGMICIREYGQNKKDGRMIIDACNVDRWYGTAEGESLRKS